MQLRQLFVAVVLGLAAGPGCRTAPYVNSHLESVNSEYRQLEDYVYCLEDENARLERELAEYQAGRPAGGAEPSAGERGGPFRRRPRGTPDSRSPELVPPTIDPGVPSETPPRRSTLNRPAGETPPDKLELEPPTVELPAPAAEPTPTTRASHTQPQSVPPAAPADTKVTHIFLNPIHTGGRNLDSRPGDDGLAVVIEPRNANDEYVPHAGAVSIVVLDPSKAGEEARVARWNFDRAATEQKLRTGAASRGIQLQMPWPASPPATEKLHLFVRYETADGRKLQSDREILLTIPGQISDRWTPRQGNRESGVGGQESGIRRQESVAAAVPTAPAAAASQRTPGSSIPAPVSAAPNLLAPPAWSPYR